MAVFGSTLRRGAADAGAERRPRVGWPALPGCAPSGALALALGSWPQVSRSSSQRSASSIATVPEHPTAACMALHAGGGQPTWGKLPQRRREMKNALAVPRRALRGRRSWSRIGRVRPLPRLRQSLRGVARGGRICGHHLLSRPAPRGARAKESLAGCWCERRLSAALAASRRRLARSLLSRGSAATRLRSVAQKREPRSSATHWLRSSSLPGACFLWPPARSSRSPRAEAATPCAVSPRSQARRWFFLVLGTYAGAPTHHPERTALHRLIAPALGLHLVGEHIAAVRRTLPAPNQAANLWRTPVPFVVAFMLFLTAGLRADAGRLCRSRRRRAILGRCLAGTTGQVVLLTPDYGYFAVQAPPVY